MRGGKRSSGRKARRREPFGISRGNLGKTRLLIDPARDDEEPDPEDDRPKYCPACGTKLREEGD